MDRISPFIGPLVLLLLITVVGPCILNAVTRFIDSQIAKVKFQLLLTGVLAPRGPVPGR